MKVVIIAPSWIGDMMMSQGLYRTIKLQYTNSVIHVVAPKWSMSLLYLMREIDQVLELPFNHGELKIRERFIFSKKLTIQNYDRAYILPNSFKSAMIPFFAGIKHRIGWLGEMRYGLLNDYRILNKKKFPLMVERYIALAYNKVIDSASKIPKPLLLPQLHVAKNRVNNIIDQFNLFKQRPIIGFCPGSESGLIKRWPHYYYAELAQKLISDEFQIILLGSAKDYEIGNNIRSSIISTHQIYCYNLAGKTSIEQVVLLLSKCCIIISNDSGLMHIAASLNRPLIALYGPSNPKHTPPLSKKAKIMQGICTNKSKINFKHNKNDYHQSLINIKPLSVYQEIIKIFTNTKKISCVS
ncbi:MAG: lipopolysaccharide heptosyltransferase II [Pantoea sp. Brub]|nr:lipopolysaccharide heptosyltransferase II [Pantoea sp. Brub]